MNDYRLALMCGTDIPMDGIPLIIHQPKIKEIAMIGETDFFSGVQVLCISKDSFRQDKSLLSQVSNFQIFMMVMTEKEAKSKRDAAMQVFSLLFPKNKILTTPRSLVIKPEEYDPVTIDESNFEKFQEVLKLIFCITSDKNRTFNPANERAKEIAEKIMRGRQKAAEAKGDDQASVLSQYLSVITVGLNSMSLQNAMDLTLYQLYDLVERYSLWVNYDLDIRSRLAGAKIEKQPENWMKNIH